MERMAVWEIPCGCGHVMGGVTNGNFPVDVVPSLISWVSPLDPATISRLPHLPFHHLTLCRLGQGLGD